MPEVEVSNGSDKEIPKVWSDIMWAIVERESVRNGLAALAPWEPPEPPYDFHGFEVTAYVLGGMGMVLLGRDPKLDRKVALKLLQSSGPKADAALMVEAQTLAKLSHPNVVTVYAVHEWEGGVYFVMEYVDGMNGHEWLKDCPTWREVLDVFIDAGQGLAAAHDKGIQHGDFKPANMLIGKDGRTRVADFGIADYLRVDDGGEPRTGRRAGTPTYMAPERLRGHRGDARSDQFSFCVAMWRALHGSRPFGGETVFQLLDEIEAGVIRHGDAHARVPYWLTRAVGKGLAEDPNDRYGDMHQLLRALNDEPPDDDAIDEPDDDDDSLEHEGRLLNAPMAPPQARPQRWGYFAAAVFSALAVLGVNMLTRSPAPEPAAGIVEAEAYTVILGLIAADRLTDAQQVWIDHASELTDEQSLQIARDWLARARQHARDDRTKAKQMASAAREVADHVERHGGSPETKKAGGQLAAEAMTYELIADDEFAEAQQTWLRRKSELTDDQAIQLAGDCLDRAEQLADVTKACAAALAALDIANRTAASGVTDESKEKGGQLAADATAFLVDHPDCRR